MNVKTLIMIVLLAIRGVAVEPSAGQSDLNHSNTGTTEIVNIGAVGHFDIHDDITCVDMSHKLSGTRNARKRAVHRFALGLVTSKKGRRNRIKNALIALFSRKAKQSTEDLNEDLECSIGGCSESEGHAVATEDEKDGVIHQSKPQSADCYYVLQDIEKPQNAAQSRDHEAIAQGLWEDDQVKTHYCEPATVDSTKSEQFS